MYVCVPECKSYRCGESDKLLSSYSFLIVEQLKRFQGKTNLTAANVSIQPLTRYNREGLNEF